MFAENIVLKPQHISKFNMPNDNIDWAKWSWNPITGCLQGCTYCYARDMAMRMKSTFPKGFEPDFKEYRLDAPFNTKIPLNKQHVEGIHGVFVCSMADMFGKWVPQDWIDKIFESCNKNTQWNYLFLTKNPQRYLTLTFPKTAWIGATADTQLRADKALDVFYELKQTDRKCNISFLSVEPFTIEKITLNESKLTAVDWIIIGGQSRSSKEPAKQPKPEWVYELMDTAKRHNIKVYCKPNLESIPESKKIKQYPMMEMNTINSLI